MHLHLVVHNMCSQNPENPEKEWKTFSKEVLKTVAMCWLHDYLLYNTETIFYHMQRTFTCWSVYMENYIVKPYIY